ncbi:hypothetical protein ACFLYJ_01750 [Candidatus Cloacimonadota bacterium]
MNKTVHFIIIFVLLLLILAFWLYRESQKKQITYPYEILLATYSPLDTMGVAVQAAYTSVLEEEGVPFKWVKRGEILKFSPENIVKSNPVIIFPDYLSLKLPREFEIWITEYIRNGGNVFITNDSGIRMKNDRYRDSAIFSSLLGLNYITYANYGIESYQTANLQFANHEAADFFQIPYGKLDDNNNVTSYVYGALHYPVAKLDIDKLTDTDIYAYSALENGTRAPNILVKNFNPGKILFANLPLGYLKAYGSDEFLLRTILRTFLFKIVKIAHIVSLPENKAGIVMNWQVESNREWYNIPRMEEKGLLRKDFPISCHISAGDWLNNAGDELGFNAAGHKNLVSKLKSYGEIGSLGGWASNWFANKLDRDQFSSEEVASYIIRNNETLEGITKHKIREFTSPRSIYNHLIAGILEQNEIVSYLYMGDAGSPPNRSFIDGQILGNRMFAFPIMPIKKHASVQELGKYGIPAAEYEKWLIETLDYVVKHKLTAMIYANFYDYRDFPQYIEPLKVFMNKAEELREDDLLFIQPMSIFADYWNKKLNTDFEFRFENDKLFITLYNPQGMKDITVALPKNLCRTPAGLEMNVTEDDEYFYATITQGVKDKIIVCYLK